MKIKNFLFAAIIAMALIACNNNNATNFSGSNLGSNDSTGEPDQDVTHVIKSIDLGYGGGLFEFEYDSEGRVTEVKISDYEGEELTVSSTVAYTYDTDEITLTLTESGGESTATVSLNPDGTMSRIVSDFNGYDDITYTYSGGLLTTVTDYYGGGTEICNVEWSNGNILTEDDEYTYIYGSLLNNYSVDLNMITVCYGDTVTPDCYFCCGLKSAVSGISSTNLATGVVDDEYTYGYETDSEGRVTKITSYKGAEVSVEGVITYVE